MPWTTRYPLLPFLAILALLAGCATDRSPSAPETQERPLVAAKAPAQRIISLEELQSPQTTTRSDGRVVSKKVHIYYRQGFQPEEEPLGESGDNNCSAFLAKGARWKTTEPYVLDSSNGDGLKKRFVTSAIAAGLERWNAAAGFAIFGPRDARSKVDVDDVGLSTDGKNEVFFANIDESGVIAVTIVWGIFGGAPASRELVEWDMILDDPVLGELGLGLEWGDAGPTDETELGDIGIMDLQNISTHETGHAAGMAHPHPSNRCAEETMFRFAMEGETKKRTLHTGDIEGIAELYEF